MSQLTNICPISLDSYLRFIALWLILDPYTSRHQPLTSTLFLNLYIKFSRGYKTTPSSVVPTFVAFQYEKYDRCVRLRPRRRLIKFAGSWTSLLTAFVYKRSFKFETFFEKYLNNRLELRFFSVLVFSSEEISGIISGTCKTKEKVWWKKHFLRALLRFNFHKRVPGNSKKPFVLT